MPTETPSELLTTLAHKAKEAEESAAAARAEDRSALEARRSAIESSIEQSKSELADDAQEQKSSWSHMESELHKSFAEKRASVRDHLDAQKSSRDAHRAMRRAEHAESDAVLAVGLALDAIEAAEYEVIDAVLARAEADELAPA